MAFFVGRASAARLGKRITLLTLGAWVGRERRQERDLFAAWLDRRWSAIGVVVWSLHALLIARTVEGVNQ